MRTPLRLGRLLSLWASVAAALLGTLCAGGCSRYGQFVGEPYLDPSPEQLERFERSELRNPVVRVAFLQPAPERGENASYYPIEAPLQPILPGAPVEIAWEFHSERWVKTAEGLAAAVDEVQMYRKLAWHPFWDGLLAKLWLYAPGKFLQGCFVVAAVSLPSWGRGGMDGFYYAALGEEIVDDFGANPIVDLFARLSGSAGFDRRAMGISFQDEFQPSYGRNLAGWLAWFNPLQALFSARDERTPQGIKILNEWQTDQDYFPRIERVHLRWRGPDGSVETRTFSGGLQRWDQRMLDVLPTPAEMELTVETQDPGAGKRFWTARFSYSQEENLSFKIPIISDGQPAWHWDSSAQREFPLESAQPPPARQRR
jgi:hypothetical protein